MNRFTFIQTMALIAVMFVGGTAVSWFRGRTVADAVKLNAAGAALFSVCAILVFAVAGVAR